MPDCSGGWVTLRRLFSSFARGWPGGGLLLMRIGATIALLDQAIVKLRTGSTIEPFVWSIVGGAAAILLLAGLWTPITAAIVTAIELQDAFSRFGDPWLCVVLATLAAGLALIGPGAWSVDAHLFGWRRVGIRDRQSKPSQP